MNQEWQMITGMFLATFGVRYVLFALGDKVELPPIILRALKFIPPVVLTAIIVPACLWPKGPNTPWSNSLPYIIGAIACVAISWKTKNLNLTILLGFIVFYVFKIGISIN